MSDKMIFNDATGNWVPYQGGGEYGMDCQLDEDTREQAEWDAMMEDDVADTTLPLKTRLKYLMVLAKDRQRREINKAKQAAVDAERAAIMAKPITWTESI